MSKKALIECVMLAAGLSSRMGDWKMMLPWGAGTLLDSALRSAFSLCDRVILVTGHRGDELARYYRGQPAITLVNNPDYASGMFSSVKCGAAAVTSRRFFLALGDMPEVSPAVYSALWQHADHDHCLVPGYDQGQGHPVLLPAQALALISNAPANSSLKTIVRQIGTCTVAVDEPGIHCDIDTPAQYRQRTELNRLLDTLPRRRINPRGGR